MSRRTLTLSFVAGNRRVRIGRFSDADAGTIGRLYTARLGRAVLRGLGISFRALTMSQTPMRLAFGGASYPVVTFPRNHYRDGMAYYVGAVTLAGKVQLRAFGISPAAIVADLHHGLAFAADDLLRDAFTRASRTETHE